jgi:hypothetical protein
MPQLSSVIGVSPIPGTTQLNVGVAVQKGIYNGATDGNADFGLLVSVTYMSINNKITSVQSGRVSIKAGTQLIGPIDTKTVAVQFNLNLGTAEAPGNQPSYTASSQIVSKNSGGTDDEVGPAEDSNP